MPTPLEDKEAIRDLLSEYCFRMDDFRFAELGALIPRTANGSRPMRGRAARPRSPH